ncbi:unnamed protein product [Rangifer tarandus platyrhynchus]|uniref:Uncharacterized protein n=1 Tax=Rangifer tarandus platyrhynchus TaxID=3082113 RepID=A0ABN8YG31_RANTA|nr:unnamed protein product [Rangifer tarandus platyrhynchus]
MSTRAALAAAPGRVYAGGPSTWPRASTRAALGTWSRRLQGRPPASGRGSVYTGGAGTWPGVHAGPQYLRRPERRPVPRPHPHRHLALLGTPTLNQGSRRAVQALF